MLKCVVIADDLTGANATGVLLQEQGYSTSTILKYPEDEKNPGINDNDCITFTTDSRCIDQNEAYKKVFQLTKRFKNKSISLLNKRIDSTLRGNLGAETDAMLDVMGEDYTAIVVPCAPASGRVSIGGYLTVDGVILHKTEAALDPKTPIHDSRVKKLFEQQTKYPVASVMIRDIDRGKEWLSNEIKLLVHEGNRIIAFDAITQEDINMISEAVIASNIHFIAVDPGAFTATLASKLIISEKKRYKNKILLIQGSVNPVAKTQMEIFWLAQQVFNVYVRTEQLIKSEKERESEISRVVQSVLLQIDNYDLFSVTGDGIQPEYRLDLPVIAKKMKKTVDEVSDIINYSMATIAHKILEKVPAIQGIYSSGGDVTAAFCKATHLLGLKLIAEPVPLAAGGILIGGDFPKRYIVTKGGMTGNPDAINICVAKLISELNM